MKFLVCKKQHGQGCGYTIGCGMRFDFIEAPTIQEAIESVVYPGGKDENSTLEGESALKEIIVVPADCCTIVDVKGMAQEIQNERERQVSESQKEKEIAELKRLLAKYGG